MPWIDTSVSLTLSYRRADTIGFWVLGSVLVWLSTTVAAVAAGLPAPWAWGPVAVTALVLPGLFWRQWFERGIWAWNGLTRRVATALRSYVLAVCYYILFSAIGLSGSTLDLAAGQPGRSRWLRRGGQPPAALGGDAPQSNGFIDFARTSGNRWAITLVPILFLLRLLKDDEQESAVPGSTYTLY